jgi:hypothetical protein
VRFWRSSIRPEGTISSPVRNQQRRNQCSRKNGKPPSLTTTPQWRRKREPTEGATPADSAAKVD